MPLKNKSKSKAKVSCDDNHLSSGTKNATRQPRKKVSKKASKVKKQIKEEIKVSKSKIQNSNADKISGTGKLAELKKVQATIDTGVCVPADNFCPFSPNAFALFVQAWIENHARYRRTFVGGNLNETCSPLEAWVYAYVVLFSVLKKYGHMSGNGTENLPSIEDYEIDLPLAKILQYYFPFLDGGISLRTGFAADIDVVTISQSFLDSNISAYSIFGQLQAYTNTAGSTERYDQVQTSTVSVLGTPQGYLRPVARLALGSVVNFIKNRFDVVNRIIATNSCCTINLSQIKQTAPDASAYTQRTISAGVGYFVQTVYYSVHRDSELGYSFSLGNTETNPNWATLDPAPIPMTLGLPYTYSAEYYIAKCAMWLLHYQEKWKDGPILTFRFRGQKLRSLNFRPRLVPGNSFGSVVFKLYDAARSLNPNFADNTAGSATTGGPLSGFLYFWWACLIMFHKKCDVSSPIPLTSMTGVSATTFAMQQFYNPGLPGLLVPPLFKDFMDCFGPVVLNGYLTFPMLSFVRPGNTTEASNMNIMRMSSTAWVNPLAGTSFFPFTPNASTAAVPELVLGPYKIDATYQGLFTADFNASWAGIYPVALFVNLEEAVMSVYKTVGSIVGNLVVSADSSPTLGSSCVMMSASSGSALGIGSVDVTFVSAKGPSTVITAGVIINWLEPATLRSIVNLTSEEVVKCAGFIPEIDGDILDHRGPYNFVVPKFGNVLQPLVATAEQAFTPNVIDPGTDNDSAGCVVVDGMMIYKNPDNEVNTAQTKYEQAFSVGACAIGGAAKNLACRGIAMGIGFIPLIGPLVSEASRPLCEEGLGALYNYVAHRSCVVSRESTTPKLIEDTSNSADLRTQAFLKFLPVVSKATGVSINALLPAVHALLAQWKKGMPK